MRKIAAVARKEFRQIARDPRTLMTLMFVPLFVLLLYGYALNFDIRHIRLAVDDRDRTPESRSLVAAFVNSGYFDLVAAVDADPKKAVVSDRPAATELMDRNDVRAVLVVPNGLGRDVRVGHPVDVQVLLNGDNSNTATTVMAYATTIIRTEGLRYAARAAAAAPAANGSEASIRAATPLVTVEPRVWYNPQLRSALFLVPGLIAYIAMISAVISTALSIVREKERGTMEQVRMAPLGATSFVVGKVVPYFAISLLSAVGVIVSGGVANGAPRVALAAPAARGMADALRYRPGSREAAALGLATYLAFGELTALFSTSSISLLTHTLGNSGGVVPATTRSSVCSLRTNPRSIDFTKSIYAPSVSKVLDRDAHPDMLWDLRWSPTLPCQS